MIWSVRGRFHHDLAIADDGLIQSLQHHAATIPAIDPNVRILDTSFVRISGDGHVLSAQSLSELVIEQPRLLEKTRAYVASRKAKSGSDRTLDVYHVNTIEVLRDDLEIDGGRKAPKGSLLTTIRNLHLVAIVDLDSRQVIWTWGAAELQRPHQPTVLPNGNLLIFDNGSFRKYSRVVEMDPRTGAIVWQYIGDPPASFFSRTRGGVQALPGGNVLVTDSDRGRVFEVTRAGEVVWEFLNPLRSADGGRRATIYRMGRLFPDGSDRHGGPTRLRERLAATAREKTPAASP